MRSRGAFNPSYAWPCKASASYQATKTTETSPRACSNSLSLKGRLGDTDVGSSSRSTPVGPWRPPCAAVAGADWSGCGHCLAVTRLQPQLAAICTDEQSSCIDLCLSLSSSWRSDPEAHERLVSGSSRSRGGARVNDSASRTSRPAATASTRTSPKTTRCRPGLVCYSFYEQHHLQSLHETSPTGAAAAPRHSASRPDPSLEPARPTTLPRSGQV